DMHRRITSTFSIFFTFSQIILRSLILFFFLMLNHPSSHTLFPYTTLFRSRKFSAFHDETGRLNVDGMNIISNDGSNKLNRSRKARVSYKVQRTINASLNAATSTRAVSSNPNFVTRQKIEIIFG